MNLIDPKLQESFKNMVDLVSEQKKQESAQKQDSLLDTPTKFQVKSKDGESSKGIFRNNYTTNTAF